MSLKQDLQELMEHQIIDGKTAQRIENYYHQKAGDKPSRLLIVLAVLGIMLIGAGILLIVANNWEEFSRPVKSFLAFVPLVISQILGLYVLLYKKSNKKWRESIAMAISFGVIIALTLISQIYHLEWSGLELLWKWILLSIPLVYIFRAEALGLFLLILSGIYLLKNFHTNSQYLYLLLLVLLLPFYIWKEKKDKNVILYFYRWAIALSVLLFSVSFFENLISLITLAGLFSFFFLWGFYEFEDYKITNNPYKWIGMAGLLGLFIVSSFKFFWNHKEKLFELENNWKPEIILLFLVSFLYFYFFWKRKKYKEELMFFSYLYFLFVIFYFLAYFFSFVYILAFFTVLGIGVFLMFLGEEKRKLDLFNLGLLSILILFFSHFFNNDLSFLFKGIAFIIIGVVFIGANYFLMKRFKNE